MITDPFWIPLIVIAIRVGVQVTVKVGARTVKFAPAAASTVSNALRSFVTLQVRAGAHVFKLDKSAMHHILTRHHPKYWNGTVKTTQTFLNPNMTVGQVKALVQEALKQWPTTLKARGTGSTFTLTGTVQGVKYTLKIVNGRVVQFYSRP